MADVDTARSAILEALESHADGSLNYAMVAGVLALTAVAACQRTAWRATLVDPLTTLRSD